MHSWRRRAVRSGKLRFHFFEVLKEVLAREAASIICYALLTALIFLILCVLQIYVCYMVFNQRLNLNNCMVVTLLNPRRNYSLTCAYNQSWIKPVEQEHWQGGPGGAFGTGIGNS